MNRRISPLAIILLAGLLVAAFALSIVNLNVALPYAQWRQALWQPDSDRIAQMLFHYSLLPRVDAVRYVRPKDLDEQTAADVHKAVDEFASSLQMHKMVAAGGLPMENELPYLVYANDAQELRMSAEALGMRLYVAVSPHLISTKGLLPEVPGVKTWPWAFAHALLVRYEREGAAQ